uniref:RING-type E3 ubiquitin transferase n=1 Tax=Fagus sylvatica TaxID=28930 RepID=A0A2N9EDW3_FAGSY
MSSESETRARIGSIIDQVQAISDSDMDLVDHEESSEKTGALPASKASIEAMPKLVVTAGEYGKECSICLEGFEVGGEAREMPCKHWFHSGCIENWLRVRGSCPLCRFVMPVEEGRERRTPFRVFMVRIWTHSVDLDSDSALDSDSDSDSDLGSDSDSGRGGSGELGADVDVDDSSTQDMEF